MDYPDYVFEDFGLDSDRFIPFPDDAILLPIFWIDDEGHILAL